MTRFVEPSTRRRIAKHLASLRLATALCATLVLAAGLTLPSGSVFAAPDAPTTQTKKPAATAKPSTPAKPAAAAKPPVSAKPAATAKPAAASKPVANKPDANKPVTSKPAATKPVATKPVAAKPVTTAKPPENLAPVATTGAVPPIQLPATRQQAAPSAARKPVTAAVAASGSASQSDMAALNEVIEQTRKRSGASAAEAAQSISDPVASKLAEWIFLRSENNGAPMERYNVFFTNNPSWPSQSLLRRRAEASLWDNRRDDNIVLRYFSNEKPLSGKGKLVLARATLARGDRAGAERLVRDAWRNDGMSGDVENLALDMFAPLITPGDQKARMDRLLYGKDEDSAMRAARRLGAAQMSLARARLAVTNKASNANALLNAVPGELHSDPGYIFSKVQLLRRAEKFAEASQLMRSAPRDPARLYNFDEWWIERRLLARKLMDVGDNRSAYIIVRDAALPVRDVYKTEQEFTAGWIALRFLKDPATASQHFARIGVDSVNPTTLARAGYWQGRAAEAAGRSQEARQAYAAAAAQSTSYYGQLARAKLGHTNLEINGALGNRNRNVERLEIVRAVQMLYALNEREMAIPIFADVGENGDPDALLGLGELASRNNDARGMLLVGKAALNRGLPFDFYAYPTTGLPSYRPIGPQIEPSIVYSIARQESAFNPSIVSPANAYGLMQVTQGAGKFVTKKYGATFDFNRLKNDPVYNTTLGAAELAGLIDDYRGSYIMTFAAYNAGRGSVRKWIERYGDPRDPSVDSVDWVEQIPFSETRNYVQRIMENLQVYRARFGGGTKLLIEADLRRGGAD